MDENNKSEFQPDLDSWDDFAGDYIKAEFVKVFPAKLACINVDSYQEKAKEGKKAKNRLIVEVEYNKRVWSFDLNKTNQKFIREAGFTPRQILGKILVVDKIKARNPQTGGMVDSLVITDILDEA